MKSAILFSEFYNLNRPLIRGWGYLYNLAGMQNDFDFMERSDESALRSDWENIGQDMRRVMSSINH